MNEQTARKAAKWWADHLRNGAKLDNGDPSPTGAMTMMMGLDLQRTMAAKRTPEDVQRFEDALTQTLLGVEDWKLRMGFGVDYHPDRILQLAIDFSGIQVGTTCLPWKSYMHIHEDGKITVSCGYGASLETL